MICNGLLVPVPSSRSRASVSAGAWGNLDHTDAGVDLDPADGGTLSRLLTPCAHNTPHPFSREEAWRRPVLEFALE